MLTPKWLTACTDRGSIKGTTNTELQHREVSFPVVFITKSKIHQYSNQSSGFAHCGNCRKLSAFLRSMKIPVISRSRVVWIQVLIVPSEGILWPQLAKEVFWIYINRCSGKKNDIRWWRNSCQLTGATHWEDWRSIRMTRRNLSLFNMSAFDWGIPCLWGQNIAEFIYLSRCIPSTGINKTFGEKFNQSLEWNDNS